MDLDLLFQAVIICCSLSYKYFLAKGKMVGWILAIATAGLSGVYMLAFTFVPIFACLEFSFCLLNGYGLYKHIKGDERIMTLDVVIIILTALLIAWIFSKEISAMSTWYQILSSVSWLAGVLYLAQNRLNMKIIGWSLYIAGCLSYAVVMYEKGSYGIFFLNLVSALLCCYGLIKAIKKSKLQLETAHIS